MGYNFKTAKQTLAIGFYVDLHYTSICYHQVLLEVAAILNISYLDSLVIPFILNHNLHKAEIMDTITFSSISVSKPIKMQRRDFICRNTRYLKVKQAMRNKRVTLPLKLETLVRGRGRIHILSICF